jgi:hypothetical protein
LPDVGGLAALLHFGKYYLDTVASDDQLVAQAVSFVGDIVEYIQPDLNMEADIDEIKKRQNIKETKRKQLIDARRGQGQFRRDLLKLWGGCAINGCTPSQRCCERLTSSHGNFRMIENVLIQTMGYF